MIFLVSSNFRRWLQKTKVGVTSTRDVRANSHARLGYVWPRQQVTGCSLGEVEPARVCECEWKPW